MIFNSINVSTVKEPNIQPLNVSSNGTFTATDGVDGYSPVTVNVASSGGSSPEMCTVTVNGECYGMAPVLYMSADGTCVYDEAPYGKGTFTVPKNSIFVVLYDTLYASNGNKMYMPMPEGDCVLKASSGDYGEGSLVLEVSGDCGISFYGY